MLVIEYTNVTEVSKLYIVNMTGQAIESQFASGTGKIELNTTSYQNGVYLARLETDSSIVLKSKFIILK